MRVGKALGVVGMAAPPNGAAARRRQARLAGRLAVVEALAEGVQPDHLAPELGGAANSAASAVSGTRRPGRIRSSRKRGGERRMREHARDIGEDIDRIDRRAEGLGERLDGVGRDVGLGGGGVFPEREYTAAERALYWWRSGISAVALRAGPFVGLWAISALKKTCDSL